MSELIFTKTGVNMLSGNSIDFEVAITPYNYSTQKETIYLVIAIAEEATKDTGVYNEIKSQKIFPDNNGLVSVDVSSIVDAYLQYFIPPANLDTIIEIPAIQCKKFQVKFTLFDGLVSITESIKYIDVIKGGIAYQYFNTDNSYPARGDDTEPKLLFITDGKDRVGIDDTFYIFFTIIPGIAPRLQPKYTINYLLEGEYGSFTQETPPFSIAVPGSISIGCMPAGYNRLGLQALIPAGAIPISYSISLNGNTEGTLEEYLPALNFTIDQRNFYNIARLLYRNSLGGIQQLRLLGQIDAQADYKFQAITKMAPPSYLLDGNIIGEQYQDFNEENQKFTGETGFMPKYQADRLRDFFLSKQRFELKDGRLIPIILNTKTAKFYSNNDNLISVQIDWQHAFTNNYFSNADMPPDVCPAMNNLEWRQTDSDEITVYWSLPFGYAYARIVVQFPGEDPQYYTLDKNSGVRKINLARPDSAVGVDVLLSVMGLVVCNRYNATPSYGPVFTVPDQNYLSDKLPVAHDDVYNITAGYSSPVTLVGSVLANDYGPAGSTIEVIANTGSTTGGGTFAIDAAGIITYFPVSSAYTGSDTFTYEIRKVPGGVPVNATVTIVVGSVATPVYGKIVLRNIVTGTHATTGEAWIDFFSNPAGTLALDVTAFALTFNYNKRVVSLIFGITTTDNYPSSIAGAGFRVMIYSGEFQRKYHDDEDIINTTFQLLTGTGYTVL